MARRALILALVACAGALTGSCMSPQEIRAYDEATCTGYGFQPGTTDFAACLQREVLARRYAVETYAWGGGFRRWR